MRSRMVATAAAFLLGAAGVGIATPPAGAQSWSVTAEEIRSLPTLDRGDRGEAVAQWQERLNAWLESEREHDRLAVDGVFGKRTEAATRAFQEAQNVPVDGVVGPVTRSALVSAPALATTEPDPAAGFPFLSRGDNGPDVARWQERLNGWLRVNRTESGRLEVDGAFGARTEAATREFQSAQGISVDGLVGAETRAAMTSAPSLVAEQRSDGERPLLTRGDRGSAVERWQDRLNDWFEFQRDEPGRPAADGIFGPRTEAATREFQAAQDLRVDGIVGPNTRAALEEALQAPVTG